MGDVGEKTWQEKGFWAIFTGSPMGIAVTDLGGTIVNANPSLARMLGHDRDELRRVSLNTLVSARDAVEHDRLWKNLVDGHVESYRAEIVLTRRDGSEMTGRASASLMRGVWGKPRYVILQVEDITERKQAEEELRQRVEELEAVMDVAPVAIWIGHDPESRDITGNRMANQFYEAEAGENVSATVVPIRRFFRRGRELAPDELPMQEASATDRDIRNVELDVLLPSGRVRNMLGSASPLRDKQGRVRGSVGAFIDITDRRHAEQELREALEREEHVSRLLQRALLPEKPVIAPGYDVAYAYIPAYEAREIGGDFYDVFQTHAGRIGILIGDVTGKGVEAASLAATTRSTVRAFAYDTSDAAESLSHANDVIMAQGQESGTFVTVLLIVLEPETGRIVWSSAGHPPAAVCRADGSVEFLEGGGNLPLGVLKGLEYRGGEAQLGPSETLILYTDGVTEARQGAELFGQEGMVRVLDRIPDRSPENIVGTLLTAATGWAAGHLRDDTALLVVERLEE